MSEAAERRRKREAEWTSDVFRGPDVLQRIEDDVLERQARRTKT